MAFPSTSEVEGYAAEKKKGLYVALDGGASWRVDMRMGALSKSETADVIRHIETINGQPINGQPING
jgi:hypothetical protein